MKSNFDLQAAAESGLRVARDTGVITNAAYVQEMNRRDLRDNPKPKPAGWTMDMVLSAPRRVVELLNYYPGRVQELLETTNRYLERARYAEHRVKLAGERAEITTGILRKRKEQIEAKLAAYQGDHFSTLEVEAALCVWEWVLDQTSGHNSADTNCVDHWRSAIGSVEARHASYEIGRYCLAVYDAGKRIAGEDAFFGHAYDWEVIPAICSMIGFGSEGFALDPIIDDVARKVLAELNRVHPENPSNASSVGRVEVGFDATDLEIENNHLRDRVDYLMRREKELVAKLDSVRRVKHLKRGAFYKVLGELDFQLAKPAHDTFHKWPYSRIFEGSKITVYQSEDDGKIYGRFSDEFEDGRFETIRTDAPVEADHGPLFADIPVIDFGKLPDDALWKMLCRGAASPEDQRYAAGWIAKLQSERDEFDRTEKSTFQISARLLFERDEIRARVENERLRFEGDLDKWMKMIGAGITGYQPEAYLVMDAACEELVKLRANATPAADGDELEAACAAYWVAHWSRWKPAQRDHIKAAMSRALDAAKRVREIPLRMNVKCTNCDGNGRIKIGSGPASACIVCGGVGYIDIPASRNDRKG